MNEILWAVNRASALVSVVLLTASLVLGMLTSARAAGSVQRHTVVAAVHRTISLLMVTFITVHVITAVTETYVDIGWIAAVVPFTSTYDRGWIGLGTIAFDLILALIVTSLIRGRIPPRVWRLVHLSAYALWPIALAHGVGSVTTDVTLTYVVVGACAVAGLAALAVRLVRTSADTIRRRSANELDWRIGAHS